MALTAHVWMTGQDPATIAFRSPVVWSPRALMVLAGASAGAALAFGSGKISHCANPVVLAVALGYIAVTFAVLIGWRYYLRAKGGVPPLRFESEGLVVPLSAYRRRVKIFPYASIRSVVCVGKGKRGQIILDTLNRAMVYPLDEFADADAFQRLRELLRQKVELLADGREQWAQMEERASVARRFRGLRPWLTIATSVLLALIYAAQWLKRTDDELFRPLDWGANSGTLITHGQSFRLVTANLLHASPTHVVLNLLSLVILGIVVEPQLGRLRFLIVLLGTGLMSQLASAFVGQQLNSSLYSVGASGMIFGVLGAQAVLNRRFGTELPGGYRFPARVWWMLLVINFVPLPLIAEQVDNAAHVGGLLSGALLTWWLCRDQAHIQAATTTPPSHSWTAACLLLVWIVGVSLAITHAFNADATRADRALLLQEEQSAKNPDPVHDNDMAWALAARTNSTREQLEVALMLAQRAVENGTAAKGADARNMGTFTDTLATTHYRMGEIEPALTLEEPLVSPNTPYPSQFARFLQHYLQVKGMRVLGDTAMTPPTLSEVPSAPGTLRLDVKFNAALPYGAVLSLLVLKQNALFGLLRMEIGASETSTRSLRITIQDRALEGVSASELTLRLAQFDSTGCQCEKGNKSGQFFAYSRDVAALP